MKQLFLALIMLSFTLPTFAISDTPDPTDGEGTKVSLKIDFGRKSKGCTKFGICSITFEAEIEMRNAPSGENTGTGTGWISNGKLVIDFDRNSMSEETYLNHFGNGKLTLEENYQLDPAVAAALGVRSYTMRAGAYAVPATRADNNTFTVSF
jgi:hypothetical protein